MSQSPCEVFEVELAGSKVQVRGDRSLYVPALSTLLIADPHFGKSASFQSLGIAVPQQVLDDDLLRLSLALRETQAAHLVILGDFFHTKASQHSAVLDCLARWRQSHQTVAITLISGNHDRHAGAPPAPLAIDRVDEPWQLGNFVCCHEPQISSHGYVLAGHLHPVVQLHARGQAGLRLPCFHFTPHYGVLPAFSHFTGGQAIQAKAGDQLFAAHRNCIKPLMRATK